MAATAYASLVSLLNTIDQVHAHPLVSTFFDINQNKTLSQTVDFLVDFVEEYADVNNREVEDLVRRIADAAHKAEDLIEVHAADRIRDRESPCFFHDLQMIIEDIESIKEEVVKVKEETGKSPSLLLHQPPPAAAPPATAAASSAPPATDEATTMVGFDDYKRKLSDDLFGHDVDRQIISITGMGGIGKTTLAKNLYENSNTKRHFDKRVWITVSQDSSARKVFLQALSCLRRGSVDMDTTDDQQLSDELYKILYNRRYLIVLDDVWSVEIWDKIKFFFPENRNGSRIIVTTRESKLFDHIGSSSLAIKFLDEENSWKLFCERIFSRQDFPPELEEFGKKIVKKCGGLPLAINVTGGFLGKSPRTQEYWEKIAKDKSLLLKSGDKNPSSVLYLSYKYLPVRLRPCLLHFVLYPEDHNIDVDILIKHWVAEGFIKSNRGRSLEEVAESYYKDLVDRNLVSVDSPFSDSESKRIKIHDLVRDLCIIIGEKENFFCAQRSIDEERHFIADQTTARFYSPKSGNPSILNHLIVPQESRLAPFKTRLLRVFSGHYPSQYDALRLQEVNMRFIKYDSFEQGDYLVPSFVTWFWSLQSLFISTYERVVAPVEIWKMPQLRHIGSSGIFLPDPDPPVCNEDVCVLQNLQTLGMVYNLIFTEEVCKRIPNVKDLEIHYDYDLESDAACPDYHLENLSCFNKLERLHYRCYGKRYCADDSLDKIRFPSSLKNLRLSGCKLEWSYIAVIASLPHLQFLHLYSDAFAETEWVFGDERFTSLKHLFISNDDNVTKWIAQSFNFPVLEQLNIEYMEELDEIPSGIGEIPTLERINLVGCMESACISAIEILHEQERFENLGLQVSVMPMEETAVFIEKIQELGLTCQNLVIEGW